VEKLGFLLHLYQPTTQEEKTFRRIADSSYIPLLKLIKNNSGEFKFTLNIPLSLLEQMDRYGYDKWLTDIKDMVNSNAVELTGSSAYHYLLTKFSENIIEDQIILNEYGLGYYFGRTSGFEGEKAIMVKDLKGFFPPEMAFNKQVHNVLNSLGYSWVLVNPSSVNGETGVIKTEGNDCYIVARNHILSDNLAFYRGVNVSDVLNPIMQVRDGVLALDAETFGHHNTDGIYLLSRLLDAFSENGIEMIGISEFAEEQISESMVKEFKKIEESTWATPDNYQMDKYRLWQGTKIQEILWNLADATMRETEDFNLKEKYEDMENAPIWKGEITGELKIQYLLNKVYHSDQFWWASGVKVGDNVLYNGIMIERALNLYSELFDLLDSDNLKKMLADAKKEITEEMKKYEDNNPPTLLSTS
jgi:predicted glycosyl hydrolase (DUF1957 family)